MRIIKMIIVCIFIIGGILMMAGCSNGKTASARDVEFLTSSEYWYHYDEATGESEKMSFSDEFTFYWGCECGEPVGNSDSGQRDEDQRHGFSFLLRVDGSDSPLIHL